MWLVFGSAAILFVVVGVGLTLAGVGGMVALVGLGLGFGAGALYYRHKMQRSTREQAEQAALASESAQ